MKKTMDEKIKELEAKAELYKLAKDLIDDLTSRLSWDIDDNGDLMEWAENRHNAKLKMIEILENI